VAYLGIWASYLPKTHMDIFRFFNHVLETRSPRPLTNTKPGSLKFQGKKYIQKL
jgi:hypothetical protein